MIVQDIAKFQEFYQNLAANTFISTFQDDIVIAQRDHIKSVLGYDLLQFYEVALATNGELSDDQVLLLTHARQCVVYFALYGNVKKSGGMIGNNGVRIAWSNDNRSMNAMERDALEDKFEVAAYKYKDDFIKMLEQLQATWVGADWGNKEWVDTQECINLRSLWLYTEDHWNKYMKIESRQVIEALTSKIRFVVHGMIKSELGIDYFNEINDEYLTQNFSMENTTVISYLNEIVANWVMGLAINDGLVKLEDEGLCICDDEVDNKSKQCGADMKSMALSLLKQLKEHLNTTASNSTYATYFSSTAYTDPDSGVKRHFVNKPGNKSFGM